VTGSWGACILSGLDNTLPPSCRMQRCLKRDSSEAPCGDEAQTRVRGAGRGDELGCGGMRLTRSLRAGKATTKRRMTMGQLHATG